MRPPPHQNLHLQHLRKPNPQGGLFVDRPTVRRPGPNTHAPDRLGAQRPNKQETMAPKDSRFRDQFCTETCELRLRDLPASTRVGVSETRTRPPCKFGSEPLVSRILHDTTSVFLMFFEWPNGRRPGPFYVGFDPGPGEINGQRLDLFVRETNGHVTGKWW